MWTYYLIFFCIQLKCFLDILVTLKKYLLEDFFFLVLVLAGDATISDWTFASMSFYYSTTRVLCSDLKNVIGITGSQKGWSILIPAYAQRICLLSNMDMTWVFRDWLLFRISVWYIWTISLCPFYHLIAIDW